MPKYLFLCRHAESSQSVAAKSDFDRPITSAGIMDAQMAATWILDQGRSVAAIYCSAANRTTSTARLLADQLKPEIMEETVDLYHASLTDLEAFITNLPSQQESVVIVGHNPAVSKLVGKLNHRPNQYVPTAGVNFFTFKTENWQEFAWSEVSWKPSY